MTEDAQNMRIVILAPHTDDAELGCGGLIAKYLERSADIHIIAFSRAEDSVPEGMPKDTIEREMRASLAWLGVAASNIQTLNFPVRLFHAHRQEILDTLIGIRKRLVPDWVLAPSTTDCHQDHQVVAQEALRAFNACRLWGYELPWNQLQATLNGFVALDEAHVTAKARALGHYTSQVELERPYFMPEFPHALAKIHGLQSRHPYAEAFEVIREFA